MGTNGIDSEWFSRTRLSSVAGTHIPEEGVEGAPVEGVVSEVRRHGACPAAVGAAPHVSEIPGATGSRTCNSSRRSSRTADCVFEKSWVSKTAFYGPRGNQPPARPPPPNTTSSTGPPRPTVRQSDSLMTVVYLLVLVPAGHHLHIASLDPESPTFDHRSKNTVSFNARSEGLETNETFADHRSARDAATPHDAWPIQMRYEYYRYHNRGAEGSVLIRIRAAWLGVRHHAAGTLLLRARRRDRSVARPPRHRPTSFVARLAMSISVALHGASALPVFSTAARSRVRGLVARQLARHPTSAPVQHRRLKSTVTRAEMEYDYDVFTIGASVSRCEPSRPRRPARRSSPGDAEALARSEKNRSSARKP